jgi:cytochrome c2
MLCYHHFRYIAMDTIQKDIGANHVHEFDISREIGERLREGTFGKVRKVRCKTCHQVGQGGMGSMAPTQVDFVSWLGLRQKTH